MQTIEIEVPDGISGDWRVETFVIEKPPVYYAIKGRPIPPGTYKRLIYKNDIVMSNTPAEVHDFRDFTCFAKGDVLINGLGLGVVLKALLQKEQVKTVTVVEISEDVINLVAPTFLKDPRVIIHHADALTWKPPRGVFYDYVWHDIWTFICKDNLESMTKLHKKYGKRCSYQDSWAREECRWMR
jgi:hypothetical protein